MRSIFFSSFIMRIAYWRTESVCVIRGCAAHRKKNPRNKIRRCKFGPHYLMVQDASLHQYIGAAQVYLSLMIQQISFTLYGDNILPIRQDITYWFCFTGAETEIHNIKDDSKIKRQTNLHRCGPNQIGTDWHISDPPTFSLPTTFKCLNISDRECLKMSYRKLNMRN